jgi:hypothetical protein
VSAAGFALIGTWLVVLGRAGGVPASLLAQVVGVVMATGLVNVPGILQGFHDLESVPCGSLPRGSAGRVPTCCCRCGRFAAHVPLSCEHQSHGPPTATGRPSDQPIPRDAAGSPHGCCRRASPMAVVRSPEPSATFSRTKRSSGYDSQGFQICALPDACTPLRGGRTQVLTARIAPGQSA